MNTASLRRSVASSGWLTISLLAGVAGAAPSPPAASGEQDVAGVPEGEAQLAVAKERFRRGMLLLEAGDLERALELFQQSRALVPSAANTVNAAYCLEKLGRIDEALELYEELLTRFADSLDDENRRSLVPAMAAMRQKVGSLNVSSNVTGKLLIDGRLRGHLPLTAPVRLMPGERVVRIIKDGYEPFEQSVGVEAGKSALLEAQLKPSSGEALEDEGSETKGSAKRDAVIDDRASELAPLHAAAGTGRFYLAAFGGWALAPGFGSDAEQDCDRGRCTEQGFVNGVIVGGRAGWELSFGAFFEAALGYMYFRKSLARRFDDSFVFGGSMTDIDYRISDELVLSGPAASLGGGYRAALGKAWEVGVRFHAGAMLIQARDTVSGEATAAGDTVPVTVDGSGHPVRSTTLFLQPEAHLGYRIGELAVGLSAGAAAFPLAGPRYDLGDARAGSRDRCNDSPTVDCAIRNGELIGERAFSPFVVGYFSVYARYTL